MEAALKRFNGGSWGLDTVNFDLGRPSPASGGSPRPKRGGGTYSWDGLNLSFHLVPRLLGCMKRHTKRDVGLLLFEYWYIEVSLDSLVTMFLCRVDCPHSFIPHSTTTLFLSQQTKSTVLPWHHWACVANDSSQRGISADTKTYKVFCEQLMMKYPFL